MQDPIFESLKIPLSHLSPDHIRRPNPDLPVLEIIGEGKDSDHEKRLFLHELIRSFPNCSLHHIIKDTGAQDPNDKLQQISGITQNPLVARAWVLKEGWRHLAPNCHAVPTDIDTGQLFEILQVGDWSLWPSNSLPASLPLHFEDDSKRVIELRYANLPLMLENNDFRGAWILTANLEYVGDEFKDLSQSDVLDSSYPTLGRLLGMWVLPSTGQNDEVDIVDWFARMVTPDERDKFIMEGGKLLSMRDLPVYEIERHTRMKFTSPSVARNSLESIIQIFQTVENRLAIEQKALTALDSTVA
jgi:hypothetical protein